MSFDVKQRERDLILFARNANAKVKPDKDYGLLSPITMFDEYMLTYYVYIQPTILLVQLVWFILMICTLGTDDYLKKYGFMTLYCCIDIFWISAQNLVMLYVFTVKDGYLRFEMCYVFEVSTLILPRVLVMFSQWMKVAHAFQKYLIIGKPMSHGEILNKRRVGSFMTVIVAVSACIGVLDFISIDFEKVERLDPLTMKPVELGFDRRAVGHETNQFDRHHFYLKITFVLLASAIPALLMLGLSLRTVCLIKKQAKFRRKFNARRTVAQSGLERLVKVTVAASILFAVLTLPMGLYALPTYDVTASVISKYSGIVYAVLYVLNIPANTLMFSWLSTSFRMKIKHIIARLRRQNTIPTG